jgi:hypothetical protein
MIYFRARSNNRQIICPEHFWCWAMSNAGTESNEPADHVVSLMTAKDYALWPIFHFATELRPGAELAVVRGMDFQPDNAADAVASHLHRFIDNWGRRSCT